MGRVRQNIKISQTTRTKTRTKKSASNGKGKRGNPNRCPACGRFI